MGVLLFLFTEAVIAALSNLKQKKKKKESFLPTGKEQIWFIKLVNILGKLFMSCLWFHFTADLPSLSKLLWIPGCALISEL